MNIQINCPDPDEQREITQALDEMLYNSRLDFIIASSSDPKMGIGCMHQIPFKDIASIEYNEPSGWVITYISIETDPNAMVLDGVQILMVLHAFDILVI